MNWKCLGFMSMALALALNAPQCAPEEAAVSAEASATNTQIGVVRMKDALENSSAYANVKKLFEQIQVYYRKTVEDLSKRSQEIQMKLGRLEREGKGKAPEVAQLKRQQMETAQRFQVIREEAMTLFGALDQELKTVLMEEVRKACESVLKDKKIDIILNGDEAMAMSSKIADVTAQVSALMPENLSLPILEKKLKEISSGLSGASNAGTDSGASAGTNVKSAKK